MPPFVSATACAMASNAGRRVPSARKAPLWNPPRSDSSIQWKKWSASTWWSQAASRTTEPWNAACPASSTVGTFSTPVYASLPSVGTCQPISSSQSGRPVSMCGCLVPLKASQSACLIRSKFGMPAFGHW